MEEDKIYSVQELSSEIQSLIEVEFKDIWVLGQISNFKLHSPSGHCYFSLKDDDAIIRCILFKFRGTKLKFSLKDGLMIKVRGSVSLYKKRGEYQIIIDLIRPFGIGELQLAFEQLQAKLKAEGLFDREFKKQLPRFPKRIGVITSISGAAIKDILSITERRFYSIPILIYPVIAQGENAHFDIAAKIKLASDMHLVDVLIIGRGGGSIEDLWAFNEEEVARAIFACSIPIISAVGHEIDFTISDYVADTRAPTPSAAAEIVLPDKDELLRAVYGFEDSIDSSILHLIENYKEKLSRYKEDNLIRIIENKINKAKMHIDYVSQSFSSILSSRFSMLSNTFAVLYTKLTALSPRAILQRGYSIVYHLSQKEKTIIRTSKDLNKDDLIEVQFNKGKKRARIS